MNNNETRSCQAEMPFSYYNTHHWHIFPRYTDRAQLLTAVAALNYPDGATNTVEGLNKTRMDVLGQAGDRSNVQNVVIVVTDGLPTRPTPASAPAATEAEAKKLIATGAIVYAVGVGPNVNENTLKVCRGHICTYIIYIIIGTINVHMGEGGNIFWAWR